MARRLGVMGGTFDPIHHGHLVAAEEARSTFDLDRVVFLPAGAPWMKADRRIAAAEHRLRMTELATDENEDFDVSDMEVQRPGPTHTVDSLREFREREPDADLYFITGADALLDLPNWEDPDGVLDGAVFVAATRPGYDASASTYADHPNVHILPVPALAISSSDIRDRVASGRPIRYLLPESVRAYIETAELYR